MKSISYFFIALITLACNTKTTENQPSDQVIVPKYAKGFSYTKHPKFTKITVHQPYKGATTPFEYVIVYGDTTIQAQNEQQIIIQAPIQKIVATSTTQIPVLEALKSEQLLKGYPNTDFISSKKTRYLIDQHKIQDIGHPENLNTELVLKIDPDVVFAFAVNNLNKTYRTLKKAGIPIVLDASWLENSPLGRAEWITFFALFLNKEKEAKQVFKEIEHNYVMALKEVKNVKNKPKILYGSMFQGVWYAPAGESYTTQLLKDAQTSYLWENTQGTGSLSLPFEQVFLDAQNTEYWLAPGMIKNLDALKSTSPHYKQLPPFIHQNIYGYANAVGATGGLLFFELGALRPDLVLKDFIKICHPKKLPNYQTTFFSKLE